MSHRFVAMWPVTDISLGMRALVKEASSEVPWLLEVHHCELVAPLRWAIRPGWAVPGSAGHETVLTAEAAAVPVPRAVDEAVTDGHVRGGDTTHRLAVLRRDMQGVPGRNKRNPPPEGEGSLAG